MTRELTCPEVVELVTDLLETALDAPRALAVERHLAGCQGCSAHVEQTRLTVALLRARRRDALCAALRARRAGGA